MTVDLSSLFPALSLAGWQETTLALDDEGERLQWGGGVGAPPLVACKGSCGSEVLMMVIMMMMMMMMMMLTIQMMMMMMMTMMIMMMMTMKFLRARFSTPFRFNWVL